MDSDLTPALFRRVKRFAATAHMATIAETTERLLRDGHAIDLVDLSKSYYPMGFVAGNHISLAVLQWLFPPIDTTEASPLGDLTRSAVVTRGLLRHLGARGALAALEFVLNVDWFNLNSATMNDNRRQTLLDDALRCASDPDAIEALLAYHKPSKKARSPHRGRRK